MISRKVSTRGAIGWQGTLCLISAPAWLGWSVGLKPPTEGTFEVWFGRLLLGWINLATGSLQRADILCLLEAGQPNS